jgi:hypothetical protein
MAEIRVSYCLPLCFASAHDKKNLLDSVFRGAYARFQMKIAGFLLLLAGWGIVLGAVALFPGGGPRASFVAAGAAVEALGLVLAVRSHAIQRERGE